MKRRLFWGIILLISLSLTACKLTISTFNAPDTASTGEIITMTITGDALENGYDANEYGIVLQIPASWQILSAVVRDISNSASIEEKPEYGMQYIPEPGYKIWVGCKTVSGSGGRPLTANIKILTGDFEGGPGAVQNYNLKAAVGAFRNGMWETDDPSGLFDFSQIIQEKYIQEIAVTKTDDLTPPEPVEQLRVTDLYSGSDVLLDWHEYDENAQKDVLNYHVYQSTSPFSNVTGISYTAMKFGTFSYDVHELTPGVTYYFAVVALDEIPNINKTVTPVSVTPQRRVGNITGRTFYIQCPSDIPCQEYGLANASITAQNTVFSHIWKSTKSSSDGFYSISNLPVGNYKISVEKYGYKKITYLVEVLENQDNPVPDEPLELKTYDQWQLDAAIQQACSDDISQAVLEERARWDVNGDNRKGLEEAIEALQVVAGVNTP